MKSSVKATIKKLSDPKDLVNGANSWVGDGKNHKFYNKAVKMRLRSIWNIWLLFACFSCINSGKNSKNNDGIVANKINIGTDSLNLIDNLYNNKIVLDASPIKSFNCDTTFDYNLRILELKAKCTISDYNIQYLISLKDTSKLFENKAFITDFKYITSYLVINGLKIDLRNLYYFNANSCMDPIQICYGNDMGDVGKHYKLKDRDILLIRGLNFFCNGSYCRNYKVLIIENQHGNLKYGCIDYPGYYPFNFENTFIFMANESPSIYIIKEDVSEIKSINDFILVSIDSILNKAPVTRGVP